MKNVSNISFGIYVLETNIYADIHDSLNWFSMNYVWYQVAFHICDLAGWQH